MPSLSCSQLQYSVYRMLRIKTFFYFFDVNTGGFFIGWLNLMYTILCYSFYMWYSDDIQCTLSHNKSYIINKLDIRINSVVVMIYYIITFLSCVGLLWGISKKLRYFLLPWLINQVIDILLTQFILFMIGYAYFDMQDTSTYNIFVFLSLVLCGFSIYCRCCILTIFQQITEERRIKRSNETEIPYISKNIDKQYDIRSPNIEGWI